MDLAVVKLYPAVQRASAPFVFVLQCVVLHFVVSCCIDLYRVALRCIVSHCIVLCRIALYRVALRCVRWVSP